MSQNGTKNKLRAGESLRMTTHGLKPFIFTIWEEQLRERTTKSALPWEIFCAKRKGRSYYERALSYLPNLQRRLNILKIYHYEEMPLWKILFQKSKNVFLTSKVCNHRWEDEGENCQWKRHELPTAVEMATLSKQEFLPRIYWKKGERGDKKILARVGLLQSLHFIVESSQQSFY